MKHLIHENGLDSLVEAAAMLTSSLELEKVLSVIVRLACDVARAEVACLYLHDAGSKQLTVAAASGHLQETLQGCTIDHTLGVPGQVVKTQDAVVAPDVRTCASFRREIDDLGQLGTQSLMASPMVHRAQLTGVIEVVNRRDGSSFDESDLKVLKIFSGLAAAACENARTHQALTQQLEGLRAATTGRVTIIGQSLIWQNVLNLCEKVARSPVTVLLLGETGTGKELTARYIHALSHRREKSFIAVNCAAVPETLLESELFGHEKGAFTGAHIARRGWFEVADGGTLFLDEIGEIERSMQAKLLRILQDGVITRVGSRKPIQCDTRIIAATNRNLKNMMIDGLFREDLYYRLSVFPIHLPALRERSEDIPIFAEYFVERSRRECGLRPMRISNEAMDILTTSPWRGNIRELQNVLERAVLMAESDYIRADDLPDDLLARAAATPEVIQTGAASTVDINPAIAKETMGIDNATGSVGLTLYAQERALIERALNANGWNQSKAARELGVSRYHLRHRIKRYGITKP